VAGHGGHYLYAQGLKDLKEQTVIGQWNDWHEVAEIVVFEQNSEQMAHRLDAVRDLIRTISPRQTWAWNYWTTLEANLRQQWQRLAALENQGLRVRTQQPPEQIYDYLEPYSGINYLQTRLLDLLEDADLPHRLNQSWDRIQAAKLERAREGLL